MYQFFLRGLSQTKINFSNLRRGKLSEIRPFHFSFSSFANLLPLFEEVVGLALFLARQAHHLIQSNSSMKNAYHISLVSSPPLCLYQDKMAYSGNLKKKHLGFTLEIFLTLFCKFDTKQTNWLLFVHKGHNHKFFSNFCTH